MKAAVVEQPAEPLADHTGIESGVEPLPLISVPIHGLFFDETLLCRDLSRNLGLGLEK